MSNNKDWCTPRKYVDAVREVFNGNIGLDPCSNEFSIVKADVEYRLPENDGLLEGWYFRTIYVNPPYGADRVRGTTIKDWIKKCVEAYKEYGSEVLALIPVATNTVHWKEYIFPSVSSICFLYDTRLKFIMNGSENNKGAPMACCMVYWGRNVFQFREVFKKFGAVVALELN